MTRLLIARHGQPEAHVLDKIQGSADFALTATGRLQGRLLADRIAREYRPVAVFSSPLQRARATAEEVASRLSVPLFVDARLAEVATGILSGVDRAEAAVRWPLPERGHMLFERIPGGESMIDAYARVAEFVLNLMDVLGEPFPGVWGRRAMRFEGESESTRDLAPWEDELKEALGRARDTAGEALVTAGATLCVVTHGGAAAQLFRVLLGVPVNAQVVVTHGYAGLSEVTLSDGRVWVVRASCQAHLPPFLRSPERDLVAEDPDAAMAAVAAWQEAETNHRG